MAGACETMKKQPRWKDREGNLYTDKEVTAYYDKYYTLPSMKGDRKGWVEVLPLRKKFPK